MKRLTVILIAVLTTACTHLGTLQPSPQIGPKVSGGPDGTQPVQQVAEPNTPPPGAEISDDPLVRVLSDLLGSPEDVATSLKINAIRGDGDKIMVACTTWVHQPATMQRIRDLANVKNTLQIVPIKPVGPLSLLAEVRRVDYDITSGALSARIAAKKKDLADLQTDAALNCAALVIDVRLVGVRLAAAVAGGKRLP